MLSDGVRLELEMIYRLQRWDRTVLVLPPIETAKHPVIMGLFAFNSLGTVTTTAR